MSEALLTMQVEEASLNLLSSLHALLMRLATLLRISLTAIVSFRNRMKGKSMRVLLAFTISLFGLCTASAEGLLNQSPYSEPRFIQIVEVDGDIGLLELEWDKGLFRLVENPKGSMPAVHIGSFDYWNETLTFWPSQQASFARTLLTSTSGLGWSDAATDGGDMLAELSPMSAFAALGLTRELQTPIIDAALSIGFAEADHHYSSRPSYIDPACSLDSYDRCSPHQICFAAAEFAEEGFQWRGDTNAPWRVLATSKNLSCRVGEAGSTDFVKTEEVVISEKQKSSTEQAREEWYFIEGNELHYFPDEIMEDDHFVLDGILRENEAIDTLVVTSDGGVFDYAMDVAQVVFDYQLNTKADIMCYSACTFILLAGEKRGVTRGARIGFHQAYWELVDIEEYYLDNQADYDGVYDYVADQMEYAQTDAYNDILYMIEQGVDPEFAIRARLSTPGDDMWYPKLDELFTANVLRN